MQAGFALLGGFLQAKTMLGYMAHCFADDTIGAVVFWIFGFAPMFGGSGAAPGLESGNLFIGCSGFFLAGGSYGVQTIMLWLFQMVFCTKAVTIIAEAVAERMRFAPYLIYSFFVCGIIHPIYGHWMWGTVIFVESKLKIDDPLGAVAVHSANGICGMLALGIFAGGTYGGVSGLITGSGGQLLAQFIGVIAAMAWAIGLGALMFYVLKVTMGLRVSELVEYEGVDVHLHGSPCYPVQAEITTQVGPEVEDDERQRDVAILEESLVRDASREKIYSDKLGRWICAKPKEKK